MALVDKLSKLSVVNKVRVKVINHDTGLNRDAKKRRILLSQSAHTTKTAHTNKEALMKRSIAFDAGALVLVEGCTIHTKHRVLSMQSDGNLVLYKKVYGALAQALWASGTAFGTGHSAIFQEDGNFVVYDAKGKAKWASDTQPMGNRLIIQEDGNLVIYNKVGRVLWTTNTCH